jgi:hypothetical protein
MACPRAGQRRCFQNKAEQIRSADSTHGMPELG